MGKLHSSHTSLRKPLTVKNAVFQKFLYVYKRLGPSPQPPAHLFPPHNILFRNNMLEVKRGNFTLIHCSVQFCMRIQGDKLGAQLFSRGLVPSLLELSQGLQIST